MSSALSKLRISLRFPPHRRRRDEITALVAEIDACARQAAAADPRVLRHSPARAPPGVERRRDRKMRPAPRPKASATNARPHLRNPSRVTCQYQPESGRSNSGSPIDVRKFSRILLRHRHVGHQRAEIDPKPPIERPLHRRAIDRRQNDTGHDENHNDPGRC